MEKFAGDGFNRSMPMPILPWPQTAYFGPLDALMSCSIARAAITGQISSLILKSRHYPSTPSLRRFQDRKIYLGTKNIKWTRDVLIIDNVLLESASKVYFTPTQS